MPSGRSFSSAPLFHVAENEHSEPNEVRTCDDVALLERTFADRAFLVGDRISIADITCCGYLYWIDQAHLAIEQWPRVEAWLRRISSGDGWSHPTR